MVSVNDESDDYDDDMYDVDFSEDIFDLDEDVSLKLVENVWESIIEKKELGVIDKVIEEDLSVVDSDEIEKKFKS